MRAWRTNAAYRAAARSADVFVGTSTLSMHLHHLRAAIDASGEIVFMTDRDGTFTFVNPRFVEVYGYQRAEVIGRVTPRILKSGQTAYEEYVDLW